jgi:DNA polymerase I-like protein with 3'-5' exonuclease and polymerase domains
MFEFKKLHELEELVNYDGELGFDTETDGKYGRIRCAQFMQRDWENVIIVEWPDPIMLMLFLNRFEKQPIIIQYASYDVSTIQDQTGTRWCPKNYDDTFLAGRLAFPHLGDYSLDSMMIQVLKYDPYKEFEIDKPEMQKADWSKTVLPYKQWLYAAIDVYHLFAVWDAVKHECSSMSYRLDKSFLTKCFDFQRNGMPVDEDRRVARYKENMAKLEEIALPINSNSYKQVRPYIGSNLSDDLGLARLSLQGNERAAQVRADRKLRKINSFLDKFESDTGFIYGKFAPGARSGRATCNDQNLEQLPRSTKDLFGYKEDSGRIMLYSDYSQLELRGAGAITNETRMIELYREGKDLHAYVAEQIFGAEYTAEHRQIAKTCNFNLLYGGGAEMFQSILIKQANIWLDIETIKIIIRKWKRLFPAIVAWQERGIRAYKRGALGSTPFGRQYMANLMTDQLNIENQGFGAEVAKLAMHYFYDDLKQYGAEVNNFIHDSYILSLDNDPVYYEPCAKLLGDAMREAWYEATKMVVVKDMPMPVSVLAGFNWGDIEKKNFVYQYKVG